MRWRWTTGRTRGAPRRRRRPRARLCPRRGTAQVPGSPSPPLSLPLPGGTGLQLRPRHCRYPPPPRPRPAALPLLRPSRGRGRGGGTAAPARPRRRSWCRAGRAGPRGAAVSVRGHAGASVRRRSQCPPVSSQAKLSVSVGCFGACLGGRGPVSAIGLFCAALNPALLKAPSFCA